MPQDELWAASARLVGYTVGVRFADDCYGDDVLHLTPRWSKTPNAARDGKTTLEIPTHARDFTPRLFRAMHYELTGGYARNVPGVARRELSLILHDLQEGALH